MDRAWKLLFWKQAEYKYFKLGEHKSYRLRQSFGTYVLHETINIDEAAEHTERVVSNLWHVFAHAGGVAVALFALFAGFGMPYSELDYHLEATNALKALDDPTKEPLEIGFRAKVCLLAKVHEDEKHRKYIEKGVEQLQEEFDMTKLLKRIRKLEPPKDEEAGHKDKDGKGKDDKGGDKKDDIFGDKDKKEPKENLNLLKESQTALPAANKVSATPEPLTAGAETDRRIEIHLGPVTRSLSRAKMQDSYLSLKTDKKDGRSSTGFIMKNN